MTHTIQTACRLCASPLDPVMSFGYMALTSYFPTPGEEAPRIPLTVKVCASCGLLQLGESTDPALMYRDGYGYKSGINESMVRHLQGIVAVAAKYTEPGDSILDIGCNDGTLLKAWAGYGVKRFGVDPIGQEVDGCAIRKSYFKYHFRQYKIITSIAMFYDVPKPLAFARNIAKSLASGGVWILEVGYAGAIQGGYWDGICHEHLAYYGIRQIDILAKTIGLNILDYQLNPTNGGSLFCVIGRGNRADIDTVIDTERAWNWERLPDEIATSCRRIRESVKGRRIHVMGASTKGNTLLQMCGFTATDIEAAIERNPDKIGRVTPGSNIPIHDEIWARDHPPEAMLVLPYHFRDGILARYADMRMRGVKFIFPLPTVEIVYGMS